METGTKAINFLEKGFYWLLGGLFLFAGILKVRDPGQFAADISNYQLLPWQAGVATALYVPWVEILAGFSLIANWNRPGALRLLLLLMLIFLHALFAVWLRGLNIECGCFGRELSTSNYAILFARDLLIFAGLGWLFQREWKHRIALELSSGASRSQDASARDRGTP